MVLVERKEMLDAFIKEILLKIDYQRYPPLEEFINARSGMAAISHRVVLYQRLFRRYLARLNFNKVFE